MDIHNIVTQIPIYPHNYFDIENQNAELEWNPAYFLFKLILNSKKPVPVTKELVQNIIVDFNISYHKKVDIEILFQKGWLREIFGRIFISEQYYIFISNKKDYSGSDFYDELICGQKIKDVIYGDISCNFVINKTTFDTLYKDYKSIYPTIPSIDVLFQNGIICLEDENSISFSLDAFHNHREKLSHKTFAKLGAYYWHYLCSLDSEDGEKNVLKFLYTLSIREQAPNGFLEYVSENEAGLFCKAAINLIKQEPDLITGSKDEIQKVITDCRQIPDYYDKDAFSAEISKITFIDLFSIYSEVFIIQREQPYIEYFIQDCRGDVQYLLSEIVNSKYQYKVPEYCEGLLKDSLKQPYVFYSLIFILKNKARLLPNFLNDIDYGHIFLLIIDELSFKPAVFNEPQLIPDNLWYECLDCYIDYISRLVLPRPDVPKIVTQIMMTMLHRGLLNISFSNSKEYIERIKKTFQKLENAFTVRHIPVRFNFVPICKDIINELPSFENSIERLWLEILVFNYLSRLPEEAEVTELLNEYGVLIKLALKVYIGDKKKRFDIHNVLYAIDFSSYVKWVFSNTQIEALLTEVNKLLGKDKITSENYRNSTENYRFVLILLCSVNKALGDIAKTARQKFLVNFLPKCFDNDFEKKCVNCFDSLDEGTFPLLPKVVELMEILSIEDKIHLYNTIAEKLTPDVLLRLYNLTDEEELQQILLNQIEKKSEDDIENSIYTIDDWISLQIEMLNAKSDIKICEAMLEKLEEQVSKNSSWSHRYENTVNKLKLFNAYKNHNKEELNNLSKAHPELKNTVLFYNADLFLEDGDYDNAINIYNQLIAAKVNIEITTCALLYAQFEKERKSTEEDLKEDLFQSFINDADKYIHNFKVSQNEIQRLLYVKINSLFILKRYREVILEYENNKDYFINLKSDLEETVIKALLFEERKTEAHSLLTECLQKYTEPEQQNELRQIFLGQNLDPVLAELKDAFKEIIILDDSDKYKILPKRINNHQNDRGLFICNMLVNSLLKMKTKCQAVDALKTVYEDYFNDILQILVNSYLKTFDFKEIEDQNRTGVSPTASNAGEADLTLKLGEEDIIIEALRLSSLDTAYLDEHETKVFGYGVSKKLFFIIVYYQGNNFLSKKVEIFDHIKTINFPTGYGFHSSETIQDDNSIAVMKTQHENCQMYHILVDFGV